MQRTSSMSLVRLKSAATAVKNMGKTIEAMKVTGAIGGETRTTSAGTTGIGAGAALEMLQGNEKGEV